ncbi:LysE family transporter [Metabacillus rhizolycopersici]|uniref:LysE family transporter n=1 Tax=Metabacillus rhizolycopersici TaxID=2875709 RepID=UPI0034D4710A
MSFLDARKPLGLTNPKSKEQRDLLTGIIFSIANPFGIAFWGGIGGGFAAQIAGMPLIDKLVLLFVGFAVGAFAWCVGITVLLAWSRKFIGEKILRGIFTLSSLAMAYFALEMLWNLFRSTIYPMFQLGHDLR